jgi:NADH-quinone oxidoreductase subunit A
MRKILRYPAVHVLQAQIPGGHAKAETRTENPMPTETTQTLFWPLGLYAFATVVIVSSMLGMSYFLGQKVRDRSKAQPYESGIASTGSARVRLSADFYLFAMFFVIFDLESIFIYSWCIAFQELADKNLGWLAYTQVCVFVGALVAALAYLWRVGALESRR